ncbi:hypothetical protein BUALT_Bualt04G0096700 [Buddleja alternifolia]|uniref:Uncharacterized protein n=1 Tax=Buddleja alternifolia TaxID=168488 RepID=A0AAV6XNZ1_9LAMI|nr:hypothetical protein BUALT_BualtUnG0032900 [Buddleja alternifolia]KAG8384234.1 hypothetical protein BUALT_Bualt04G0096700 [Buddleja alternifolia]
MGRAPCCDKANVKRGPWSPEEDSKLKSYIEQHGLKRCGKSCRLRWLNYLRPNIRHGGFTEDEDNLICTLYLSIGSRWSIIAGQLPGRTDNDIKNYWNTKLKKKLLGKQRREQSKHNTKRCDSIDESFRLCSWPPPQPPTPPSSQNSPLAATPITPNQLEPNYSYNYHTQFEAFHYVSDVSYSENQQLCKDLSSTCPGGFINGDFHDVINGDNNFEAIYDIPEEIILYNNMHPQQLEMVNNSRTSTVSPESSSNLNVYNSSDFPNYEICNMKMSQDWTFFDDPRLLGYSQ